MLLSLAAPASAANHWPVCGPSLLPPAVGDPARRNHPDEPTRIEAGSLRYDRATDRYVLTEHARLTRADQRLEADRAVYDADTARVEAQGSVRYQESGLLLEGARGEFFLDQDQGWADTVEFRVEPGHLHGAAERANVESRTLSRLRSVRITTCEPGQEQWWLRASRVTLDREADEGHAFNGWLQFFGVPVFYLPYINFPLSDARKSGLLVPSFGSTDRSGTTVRIPYYWNIAPNLDATLAPTWFGRRGLLLDTEVRYLLPWASGELRQEVLPDDDLTGDTRWEVRQSHRARLGGDFSAAMEVHRVSDDDYIDDFAGGLEDSVTNNLESRASVSYARPSWRADALVQGFQTIDPQLAPAAQPYDRLPQARLRYRPALAGLLPQPSVEARYDRFHHDAPELRTTGQRLELMPRVAWPLRWPGYYLEPAVAWNHVRYRLDPVAADAPEQPSRSLPVASLDAGLFLEREFRLLDRGLLQTLEPRLFYLYVPERDQDDLPLFDTGLSGLTASYSELFRTNRFTGPDRFGDANQLTVGLTSRVLGTRDGFEYLRISGGQILFFRDREVQLRENLPPETDSRSDYVAELRLGLPMGLRGALDMRWDPDDFDDRELRSSLTWRPSARWALNLGYRQDFERGERVQSDGDISVGLPLARHWSLLGGWQYSFLDDATRERFAGFAYTGCCWAIRGLWRQFIQEDVAAVAIDEDAELQSQFMVELELRGLGGVGDEIMAFIQSAVPGFRPGP